MFTKPRPKKRFSIRSINLCIALLLRAILQSNEKNLIFKSPDLFLKKNSKVLVSGLVFVYAYYPQFHEFIYSHIYITQYRRRWNIG